MKFLQILWCGSLPRKLLMAQRHHSHCMSCHCSFFNIKGIYTAKYLWSQSHVCSITAGSHRDGCFVTKQRYVTPRWRVNNKTSWMLEKHGSCFEINAAVHKSNTLWSVLGWHVFHKFLYLLWLTLLGSSNRSCWRQQTKRPKGGEKKKG